MKSLYSFVSTLCLLSSAYALLGIDFAASSISIAQFSCLAQTGVEMTIGSVYSPLGFVDETGISNLINSYQSDLTYYPDAYMTPCLRNCQNNLLSGADQANAVINSLNKELSFKPFIFVNIDKSQPWSSNQTQNQQFIMDILNTINKNSGAVGVITSYNSWSSIVGANFTSAAFKQDLLWVNWNGKQDITTGFTPFGGWKVPDCHQYAGQITSNSCINATLNYDYWDSSFIASKKEKKMVKARRLAKNNGQKKFNRI